MTIPARPLPLLPLLLWKAPPGLAMILEQEGIAFRVLRDPSPLALRAGRFVLHDGRRASKTELKSLLRPEHDGVDVRSLAEGESDDPFEVLLDTTGRESTWELRGFELTEHIARRDRASIRRRLLGRLRSIVAGAGGVWARLAAYPFPYRSAFNLRVDLDEPLPDDYHAFARARRPIDGATTHFVSTHAYGDDPGVLGDLLPLDTHSHGHYHVVYREAEANRVNLRRAADLLVAAGIEGRGFASPHGRWNLGLNGELEERGCSFSSEFQVGYDDFPFFPWTGTRPSTVLQVPVHPICEGLFFDAGATDAGPVGRHLVAAVRAKVDAGEPAFVYGHPERRLGRFPGIVTALAATVVDEPGVWKVGLGAFADWWRWRLGRSWSLIPVGEGSCEVRVDDWDERYPLGLEIVRDGRTSLVPIRGPVTTLAPGELVYERPSPPYTLPPARPGRVRLGVRGRVRRALDWETVTPVEDLPAVSIRSRLKRGLRLWREGRAPAEANG